MQHEIYITFFLRPCKVLRQKMVDLNRCFETRDEVINNLVRQVLAVKPSLCKPTK